MKGNKIEGIGSLRKEFISCSNEVNCSFVVISYACANVTTIILNGTCKNLSACQLTLVVNHKKSQRSHHRENMFPFFYLPTSVWIFLLLLLFVYFFGEGKDCSVQRITFMYLSSQCVPRYNGGWIRKER